MWHTYRKPPDTDALESHPNVKSVIKYLGKTLPQRAKTARRLDAASILTGNSEFWAFARSSNRWGEAIVVLSIDSSLHKESMEALDKLSHPHIIGRPTYFVPDKPPMFIDRTYDIRVALRSKAYIYPHIAIVGAVHWLRAHYAGVAAVIAAIAGVWNLLS